MDALGQGFQRQHTSAAKKHDSQRTQVYRAASRLLTYKASMTRDIGKRCSTILNVSFCVRNLDNASRHTLETIRAPRV